MKQESRGRNPTYEEEKVSGEQGNTCTKPRPANAKTRTANGKTRSANAILSFIIVIVPLAMISHYIVVGFTFEVTQRTFAKISDTAFTQVLIEGQMTREIEHNLKETMQDFKFDPDKLIIKSNYPEVVDVLDTTYAPFASGIEMTIIYDEQHDFGLLLGHLLGNKTNVGRMAFKGYGSSEFVEHN